MPDRFYLVQGSKKRNRPDYRPVDIVKRRNTDPKGFKKTFAKF